MDADHDEEGFDCWRVVVRPLEHDGWNLELMIWAQSFDAVAECAEVLCALYDPK